MKQINSINVIDASRPFEERLLDELLAVQASMNGDGRATSSHRRSRRIILEASRASGPNGADLSRAEFSSSPTKPVRVLRNGRPEWHAGEDLALGRRKPPRTPTLDVGDHRRSSRERSHPLPRVHCQPGGIDGMFSPSWLLPRYANKPHCTSVVPQSDWPG